MSDAYPGHFLDRPTAEDYAAFRHRRRRAEAEPLEGGDVLTWTGRSLEPDVLPPPDYPHDRSTSPNPPRPIHRALLDSDTGPSSRPWTLKLVEGLQTGVDQDSQVWRAKARPVDDPQTVVPVVVKLRHEALFPEPSNRTSLPICDNWNWFSAAYPQEREALAYRTARDLQGTDLPLCYGFFKFRLPNGEEFVAVVLEDLVDSGRALQLDQYLVREATVGRLDLDGFDKVACAAHRLQHRFHERDIGGFVLIQTEDFLYLRSASAQDDAALVGIGFGKTSSRSRVERAWLETVDGQRGMSRDPEGYWCTDPKLRLLNAWRRPFMQLEPEWFEMVLRWTRLEGERRDLWFLDGVWRSMEGYASDVRSDEEEYDSDYA